MDPKTFGPAVDDVVAVTEDGSLPLKDINQGGFSRPGMAQEEEAPAI